jgi:predicted nucleotidyltransferase
LQNLLAERLHTTPEEITDFCQRQNIIEFALFGSVLRDDFGPDSDVDVLVTYAPDHHLRWQDWLTVKEELEQRFGRSVDVVEKPSAEESVPASRNFADPAGDLCRRIVEMQPRCGTWCRRFRKFRRMWQG